MKPYLLLVEDDEAASYLTLKALGRSPFSAKVIRVRDGAEAVQHLLSDTPKPALILLDLKLPKLSGIEVLEKIRSTADLTSIPVVVLTASDLAQDRAITYVLGISRYIVKPMDNCELVSEMAEVTCMFDTLSQ